MGFSHGLNPELTDFKGCAFSSSEQTPRPPAPLNASAIEPGATQLPAPNAASSVLGFALRPVVGEIH
jgi:hypothetical protein